jgi:cobyrinic acid a,c-diamide synthase
MIPGLLIAAPASGTGKTTVMLGLLRAFARQGLRVQPFKNGPDYIDPAFHQAACGRASFNLDSWAMAPAMLHGLARQGTGADLILAEGSMGLFDGVAKAGETGNGASADLARLMGWPVVLVLDVSGQAQSAAATALGFARLDPQLPFAGVILNRVASPRHESLLRAGMEAAGLRVLGALPRRADLSLPERHLGLVQAMEHPDLDATLDTLATLLRDHVDLDALRAAASGQAPIIPLPRPCPHRPSASRWRATRPFRSSTPISFKAGRRRARKSCRSRRWPTRRPMPGPIWSGCPVAIPNCTQAASPPRRPS